jgi:pimeloyl-ACP methyl ester carboxylesterase
MGCGGSTVVSPKATEITFDCSDGIRLAAQSWRVNNGKRRNSNSNNTTPFTQRVHREELRVLCLHGWMDNCRSFFSLAPALIEQLDAAMINEEVNNTTIQHHYSSGRYQHVHVVALDLPGHGLSFHKSQDAPPMIRAEYLFYIAEAIRLLNWCAAPLQKPVSNSTATITASNNSSMHQQNFVLVGHSMSAGISLMYAAAFPEQVRSLVLLDSLGTLAKGGSSTSYNLRKFVQSQQLEGPLFADPLNRFYYPTLEAAIQSRMRSAKSFPGNQSISLEAAKELVQRGVTKGEEDESSGDKQRRFRFRHDPRLMWSSLLYLTDDQVDSIYRDIQCPTCILLGSTGWPVDEQQKRRLQEQLRNVVIKTLPGSHHLHMDPDTAEAVVQEIVAFLDPSS